MAVKHYMSIFLDERLHQEIQKAAAESASTKSRVGRIALELYLAFPQQTRAWIEALASTKRISISEAVAEVLAATATTQRESHGTWDETSPLSRS